MDYQFQLKTKSEIFHVPVLHTQHSNTGHRSTAVHAIPTDILVNMIYYTALFALALVYVDAADLGNGLWRTFGHQTALPLTAAEATKAGWKAISSCEPDLGVLFAQSSSGPSEKHPLALRFTSGGQIAGIQTTVYGSNKITDAAPANLVELGYWKAANASETWLMDVSFRSSAEMCSGAQFSSVLG